jgi:hypothetical protein
MDSVAGSAACAVKVADALWPAIACRANLYPFVEELRCAKRPAKAGKCAYDVIHGPAAEVANN